MSGSQLAKICAFTTRKKLCLYISLLLLAVPPAQAEDTQPNILFIVVDNQPASILGAYGNPDVKTPNIDRLANEGMRFTRAYCANPICQPSRTSMFTGRYPHETGIQDNAAKGFDVKKYPMMGKIFPALPGEIPLAPELALGQSPAHTIHSSQRKTRTSMVSILSTRPASIPQSRAGRGTSAGSRRESSLLRRSGKNPSCWSFPV